MTLSQQDQDAINHIASVSKHKHAEIIAKWLITGWDVKLKGFDERLECPSWLNNVEYELIEPKPPKPAYRVYQAYILTGTVDRYSDGTYSANYHENLDWLTDWIEYDPDPKKWPTPLVARIAAIDIKAAEWIVDHWDELLEVKYIGSNNYSRDSDRLLEMFVWNKSDQGHLYWRSIADKLGE